MSFSLPASNDHLHFFAPAPPFIFRAAKGKPCPVYIIFTMISASHLHIKELFDYIGSRIISAGSILFFHDYYTVNFTVSVFH